jgi:acetyl-CoA carboxylase carboxyl transferase subunit beta
MNWLSNLIPPRIRSFVGEQKEVPDHLWQKCTSCEAMLFHRDLAENLNVCYQCGHHLRLSVADRLKLLFDGGEYEKLELPKVEYDPLKFKDRKKYVDRIKEAQTKTGLKDAITVASGKMGGLNVVIAAFNFRYMGGSMGAAVGEGIVKAAQEAVKTNAALIIVPASGGARMQEGMISLMQMPRSIIAVEMVKDAHLPYIVILTDPTTGGVSASFAMVGDIHIAEPGAQIGFAGRRVIEETVREKLPADFQTAEYLLAHGMVDMVVPRKDMRKTLINIISILTKKPVKTPLDGDKSHKAILVNTDVQSSKAALSQVKSAQTSVRNIRQNADDITGQEKIAV